MNTILHIWQAKVQALVECDFHSGITEQLIQIQTLKNISITTTDSYNISCNELLACNAYSDHIDRDFCCVHFHCIITDVGKDKNILMSKRVLHFQNSYELKFWGITVCENTYELRAYAIKMDRLYSVWRYTDNSIATLTYTLKISKVGSIVIMYFTLIRVF